MTPAARVQAAIELLDLIIDATRTNGPAADTIIGRWFKTRRYAGSKDRRAVADLVYRAIRAFGEPPENGRAAMLAFDDLRPLFDGSTHGPNAPQNEEHPAALSILPSWLEPLIAGDERAALLDRAPFDLRVNALRVLSGEVQSMLDGTAPIAFTNHGLRLAEHFALANRPELAGLVEVQDAGSQIIANACAARAGETVVDLCAGAGGKTLALAADMQNDGRLIACDTDRGRLDRLAERARVADATVERRLLNPRRETEALADLAGQADCVLVDAPCSGSGTWRRNPELRWRLTPQRLDAVARLQAEILDIAATLVRPGGRLVYAVCSLIADEGVEQIERFLTRHSQFSAEPARGQPGRAVGAGTLLTPAHDSTDGFFFATLKLSC